MHDATAVVILTIPEIFKIENYPVEISCEGITRGMTCADRRLITSKPNNVRVVMDVNQKDFSKYILESIRKHDEH